MECQLHHEEDEEPSVSGVRRVAGRPSERIVGHSENDRNDLDPGDSPFLARNPPVSSEVFLLETGQRGAGRLIGADPASPTTGRS